MGKHVKQELEDMARREIYLQVTCRLLCDNTLSVFFNRLKIDTNDSKYVLETEDRNTSNLVKWLGKP